MQSEGKLPPGCVCRGGGARPDVKPPAQPTLTGVAPQHARFGVGSTPKKYPSAFAAYAIIARQEGVAGLWTGVGPNIGRNAIINAAELASYDQARGAGQLRRHS